MTSAAMSARTRRRPSRGGFSLIELLIAMAIVAVLVALAYPSFIRQIQTSRRSDAKSALLACAQMLERFSSQNGNYSAGADAAVTAACIGLSRNGYYTMPAGNVPAAARAGVFLIQARPNGMQTSDGCGSFTYAQDGSRGVAGATLASNLCW